MSVVSTDLLRWVRSENYAHPWHLTLNGRDILCGLQHWGGPPLRPHVRSLTSGAPNPVCAACQQKIAELLDLTHAQGSLVPR